MQKEQKGETEREQGAITLGKPEEMISIWRQI